jgi:hypothetical protein
MSSRIEEVVAAVAIVHSSDGRASVTTGARTDAGPFALIARNAALPAMHAV